MARFDYVCKWDELKEVKGMSLQEVLSWLEKKGVDKKYFDCGDEYLVEDVINDKEEDFDLYLHGYWSDNSPVIEFEDGKVVRWYRTDAWD